MVPVRLLMRRLVLRRKRLLSAPLVRGWFGFSRVVLRLDVGVVRFVVGGAVDARGVRGCWTYEFDFLSVCMMILIMRRCVVWSFFRVSSVIVLKAMVCHT